MWASSISPEARSCVDAGLALYVAAMGDAPTAPKLMQTFTLDELPDHVVGQIANMGATILGTAGRTSEAVALAQDGRARVAHSLDAAVVRFSISDAHIRALLLAGRIPEAFEVTERAWKQQARGDNSAPKYCACRPPRSSVTIRGRRGCSSWRPSSRAREPGSYDASPTRCALGMAPNWAPFRRLSRIWAISSQRLTLRRMRPSHIVVADNADLLWHAPRERMHSPDNPEPIRRRFVRPPCRYR
jgi:hypothetical protein